MTDSHGRIAHADTDRRRRPVSGYRLRSVRRFAELVEDCLLALPRRLRDRVVSARLRIVDVPGDTAAHDRVATYDPRAHALTVYRRPAELRADSRAALGEVVTVGVTDALDEAAGFMAEDRNDPRPDHWPDPSADRDG